MLDTFGRAKLEKAAAYIRARSFHRPAVGVVLGSGLNPLAEEIAQADVIPYEEIPHFPAA
ncbi:MAG: purine-nucleoside phosphorylase, partial [Deltaproteobacteria bacterium]|nr:purine-nucleoside phosphorylase [Deltaproteobacteria bacterium]